MGQSLCFRIQGPVIAWVIRGVGHPNPKNNQPQLTYSTSGVGEWACVYEGNGSCSSQIE
jgi:hypothetical protein